MPKPTASDFFDPALMKAQFAANRIAGVDGDELVANGATLFARLEFTLNDQAQLAGLQRMVKDTSLGKVFADGEVFDAIAEQRVVDVSFYKLPDDTGVQIARIAGGADAMRAMLAKADIDDLDLQPKYIAPKAPEAAGPQRATLMVSEDQKFEVTLKAPKAPKVHRDDFPTHRAGIGMPLDMRNPIALKTFLGTAMTAASQAVPSPRADDMIFAAFMATSSHIHPQDTQWPEGITVANKMTATPEPIDSPARAMAVFAAALSGDTAPVIARDDLVEQFRARKAGMK